MAHKNPNQNVGILVTVRKSASVRLPLPCQRIQRRVLELLQEAKVRSTEYTYTLSGVGTTDKQKALAVTLTTKPDTTLEFGLSIVLNNGELFVGNLKAPVKCREDGLTTELRRAATIINGRGWHESSNETQQTQPSRASLSKDQRLLQDMRQVLRGLEVEHNGVLRDALNLERKRVEIVKTIGELRKNIALLTSGA